jgi:hypothetical protein
MYEKTEIYTLTEINSTHVLLKSDLSFLYVDFDLAKISKTQRISKVL